MLIIKSFDGICVIGTWRQLHKNCDLFPIWEQQSISWICKIFELWNPYLSFAIFTFEWNVIRWSLIKSWNRNTWYLRLPASLHQRNLGYLKLTDSSMKVRSWHTETKPSNIGGSKGALGRDFSFSWSFRRKFGLIILWRSPLWCCPSHGKSWILQWSTA